MPLPGSIQSSSARPTREEAEKWLRDALNHLYDLGYLDNHPLAVLLVRSDQASGKRGTDLRKALIAAIQARKPPRGTPAQSPDWRGYQILEHHIISGLSPAEVMQKLNISRSLFFLEKARILKALFDDLWAKRIDETEPSVGGVLQEGSAQADLLESTEAADLLQHAAFAPVDIRSLLDSLRPLIEPLARAQNVRVAFQTDAGGVILRGERVLLRQVLLSLVTELMQLAAGGELFIRTFEHPGQFGIQLDALKSSQESLELRLAERRGLQPEVSYQVIRAMKGKLTVDVLREGSYRAVAAWPREAGPRKLLLVDDHPDIAELFTRYLAGSGMAGQWDIVWAASTEEARQALADHPPALIILDVILPHEDGWEFLIALKADALTREIPVVVCSAINEPDLVRSLGAQGYLPKPFSAVQLVQALAPWTG